MLYYYSEPARACAYYSRVNISCVPEHVSACTVGAGSMAPPTSTTIAAWLKCAEEHSSRVNMPCHAASVPTRERGIRARGGLPLLQEALEREPVSTSSPSVDQQRRRAAGSHVEQHARQSATIGGGHGAPRGTGAPTRGGQTSGSARLSLASTTSAKIRNISIRRSLTA